MICSYDIYIDININKKKVYEYNYSQKAVLILPNPEGTDFQARSGARKQMKQPGEEEPCFQNFKQYL